MPSPRAVNGLRIFCAALCFICGSSVRAAERASDALDALVAAYPDALARHDGTFLYWKDGTRMPVGAAEPEKGFEQRLRAPSILDQFHQRYPAGGPATAPAKDFDPGRFRNEAFFRKLYGDCRRGEVTPNLTSVRWFPKGITVKVTKLHGVAAQLAKVAADIDKLPEAVKQAAYPIAGTYACRTVLDTGLTSVHAYAAAIDLNQKVSEYWGWEPKVAPRYRNRMPLEIVEIFERHGFIWGGRWYHYDTMHFEYRPELLSGARP
jgi:hypothetical protein